MIQNQSTSSWKFIFSNHMEGNEIMSTIIHEEFSILKAYLTYYTLLVGKMNTHRMSVKLFSDRTPENCVSTLSGLLELSQIYHEMKTQQEIVKLLI